MQRTYLALATIAAATAAAMTELAAPLHRASAGPSRAPLAQQQPANQARPRLDRVSEPRQEPLTALPPGEPPPLESPAAAEPIGGTPGRRIVALQVIPFSP